ncbi:MAG: hypothetical protein LBG60_06130 [Bifidobacteriaceae bacterium]|jgi:folate-binding protein YgfZ|nr:hypothetical protein [Bifidobacteriaceae bacterium]
MGRYDLADQRAFAARQPVFALPDAVAVVALTGPDALRLVSALTTLPPGLEPGDGGAEALLLDGQGHIVFALMVARAGDGLVLLTDGSGEALAELLNSRRFRLRAAAEARPDLRVLVTPAPPSDRQSTAPPGGQPPPAQLDGPGPTTPPGGQPPAVEPGGPAARGSRTPADDPAPARPRNPLAALSAHCALRDDWPLPPTSAERARVGRRGHVYPRYALGADHPGSAWTGLTSHIYDPGAASPLPDRLARRGHRQIDAAVLEGLRIAAWRPLAGREAADGKTLPHELDWLRSTTPMNSGCYPGQETVAKIVNLGRPPRRLVFLHLDGSEAALPEPGAEVQAPAEPQAPGGVPGDQLAADQPDGIGGWQVVGRVTSAAVHHELGPIALALVKRSLPSDAGLAVAAGAPGGLVAASQTVIVPPSGESDARPATHKLPIRPRRPTPTEI